MVREACGQHESTPPRCRLREQFRPRPFPPVHQSIPHPELVPAAPLGAPDRLQPAFALTPQPWSRGWCAAEACRFEASAPKPGNVFPGAPFTDLSHAELVAAGRAIAPAMDSAPGRPLGRTILDAVTASRLVTRSNANLGIILAIAPMAAVPGSDLSAPLDAGAVAALLAGLTPADAADTWRAIESAAPGGMGRRGKWDLGGPPPENLLAAMALASPLDSIARLWVEGYGWLLDGLVNDILGEIDSGHSFSDSLVRGHLRQLARQPDSLIHRRHGAAVANAVSLRAAEVIASPSDRWRQAVAEFDRELRAPLRINPGTTADLCAAAVYILLRDGRLRHAFSGPPRLPDVACRHDFRPLRKPRVMQRHQVRLRKAVHVFAAGHFITLSDQLCEPIHGHNWTVAVTVDGIPDAHGMVVDFICLRDTLSVIISRLDHRMLLPTGNPLLPVTLDVGPDGVHEVTVRFGRRRWVFPADECVLLPLANTTAEWIAGWIGHELRTAMAAAGSPLDGRLCIAVDECLGQEGVWESVPE
ncbi:MAG: hypothetical protein DWH79_07450 [Planctomycetota bacterium]|nr:MAG: hypothetical protein DWH79_07450 [Planctomycetota bacterium]